MKRIKTSVSIVVFSGFFFNYVLVSHPGQVKIESRRNLINYAYLTITATLLAVMERALLSPAIVHAEALEAIKSVWGDHPIPIERLKAIKDIAARIKTPTAMEDYAAIQAALGYSITKRKLAEMTVAERTRFTITGRGTLKVSGSSVAFAGCGFLFENLTIIAETPPTEVIQASRGCSSFFKGTKLQGFTQDLGNLTWIDVHFSRCVLTYGGGPITMFNVSTQDCQADSSVPQMLRSLISSGKPFAFAETNE